MVQVFILVNLGQLKFSSEAFIFLVDVTALKVKLTCGKQLKMYIRVKTKP